MVLPLSGATAATYIPATTTSGTTYYYVIVTGTCGAATSNTAQVIVNTAPAITGQPLTTQTKCQGIAATALTVTATGTNLTYQWFSNASNSTTGGSPVGTNSNTYTPVTTAPGTTYYYVVVSNGGCAVATLEYCTGDR